jgi:hypothetical protein
MDNMTGHQRKTDSFAWKLLGYLLDSIVVGLLGWGVWMTNKVNGIELGIAKISGNIEAHSTSIEKTQIVLDRMISETAAMREWKAETAGNRFTASDGAAVWREIAAIRENIAKMPTEIPPKWFVERVDKIDCRLEKIEIRVFENAALLKENPK